VSCEQTIQFLGTFFGLGDCTVQAAVLVFPKIVDQAAFESVLAKGFKFEEERADVRKRLNLK
jgi:hypothetical protein